MTFKTILYTREDRIAIATLNQPERMNSLSRQLLLDLLALCDEVERDPGVRALVITGSPRPDGRPCFCPGADLKELAERAKTESLNIEILSAEVRPVWSRIEGLKKPTIAAIDGPCSAGGLVLAMCCDFRLAAETARIADLHIKNMGLIGGDAPGVRFARLLGPARAKEIMFLGEFMDGKEAYRIGLASRCFPSDKLMEGARDMARKIAGMRAAAITLGKDSINATTGMPYEQALAYTYKCNALLDTTEGARAFTEKRAPKFDD